MSQLIWNTIKDIKDAPGTCGVYQYWAKDELLYIGKAINLKARLSSHAQNARLDAKEAAIVAGDTIRYTLCDTEFKALLLESELIRKYRPPHNRIWKDDKSYLYIVIDLTDPFPRPHFARAKELTAYSQQHTAITKTVSRTLRAVREFGPFPNNKIAEEVLRAIRRLIPFCMAKKVSKHPCFYSRIGLCHPCPSSIHSAIEKRQYRLQIRHVIKILEGDVEPVIKDLMIQMKQASKNEDFEKALSLRTGIERFERFISAHSFSDRHFSYNNSDQKLKSLENILQTNIPNWNTGTQENGETLLHRIECYDASNSAMYDSVVSLTVMTDGLLDNGQYRRFKIKNPRAISDFDRLDEAITRRLKNTTWPKPDLIVIDGGVPQLRRLQRIFDRLAEPPLYLGLAKHPDRLIIPDLQGETLKGSKYITVKLPSDDPGLQLLEQLRDEAHRFANSYRKILERKRTKI
ncbi:MAG: GIY-YIG nuclease family protein [bacterium]